MILLVHHGEAVDPAVDCQRPLSPRGRQIAEALATACAARGVRPSAVWHSGKLRARQTAEAFWLACNPLAEFAAVKGLQPTDPPELIRDVVAGDPRQLVIVGHMPHLECLMQLLLAADAGVWAFPSHGVVALEPQTTLRWVELWRLAATDVEPSGVNGGGRG
jgi:phosphohistidine phosphatase